MANRSGFVTFVYQRMKMRKTRFMLLLHEDVAERRTAILADALEILRYLLSIFAAHLLKLFVWWKQGQIHRPSR